MIKYDFGPHIAAFTSERDDIVSQDVLLPKLTHSCHVEVVNERAAFPDTDALITQVPGLWIGVYSADCVPVLIADKRLNVVAAVHAGWRGTVGGITRAAVERMKVDFGCRPEDMQAVIGPSISPDAFEVGEEVVMLFRQSAFPDSIIRQSAFPDSIIRQSAFPDSIIRQVPTAHQASSAKELSAACPTTDARQSSFHIDLWQANRWLLTEAGLQEEQILLTGLCTKGCPDRFFSARREGYTTGRLVSAICIMQ